MGHLQISCRSCHEELESTTLYESPHDIRHRQRDLWRGGIRPPWRPLQRPWRVSNQLVTTTTEPVTGVVDDNTWIKLIRVEPQDGQRQQIAQVCSSLPSRNIRICRGQVVR